MRRHVLPSARVLGWFLFLSTATSCTSSAPLKKTADSSIGPGDIDQVRRDASGAGGAMTTGGVSHDDAGTVSGAGGASSDVARDVAMADDSGPSSDAWNSGETLSVGGTRQTGGTMATGGATTIDGTLTTRPYATGGLTTTGGFTGTGGVTGAGGMAVDGAAASFPIGPCDIYAAADTPCAAAYSMTRLLSSKYQGPLYQVRSMSSSQNTGTGGTTKDIGVTTDGYADSATQDDFCLGTFCTVSLLYDQSGNGNHLKVAPKGIAGAGEYSATDDFESSATKGAVTAGGHRVYSLYMAAREGYRLTAQGTGMPVGDAAQGIYELADGTRAGSNCCWEFGNAVVDPTKWGASQSLFFGFSYWTTTGAGDGPWFMADFNGVLWAGGSRLDPPWGGGDIELPPSNSHNPSMKVPFALGMLRSSKNRYAIRVADVRSATDLITAFDGDIPVSANHQGGIILGIGTDNSNSSSGTFYEGAITSGYPTDQTDLAVMKNIQAVGYSK